jgi:hypothetical protein
LPEHIRLKARMPPGAKWCFMPKTTIATGRFTVMRKLFVTGFLALVVAVPAFGSSAAPIQVRMKDPGCHWFYVNGKYVKSLKRTGPVTILNLDEAALKYAGPGGAKLQKVGAKLTLKTRGTYRITMVRQAHDDNTLTLIIG